MYEMSQERAEPVMPILESLEINISWQTVSKAALKSRSIRNLCQTFNPGDVRRPTNVK